jgi:hypothetical protein
MDRTESPTPSPTPDSAPTAASHDATIPEAAKGHPSACPSEGPPSLEGGLHDFDAQKRIHQQIRNDPDYDDWEYGTEPLPHEAWVAGRTAAGSPPSAKETP